jgi:hypothetical protein
VRKGFFEVPFIKNELFIPYPVMLLAALNILSASRRIIFPALTRSPQNAFTATKAASFVPNEPKFFTLPFSRITPALYPTEGEPGLKPKPAVSPPAVIGYL